MSENEKIIRTTCASHCGGTCIIRAHVKDGVVVRIETDDGEEPQLRACARGRAYRQRLYGEERVLYPLKRIGERGEGKFERISWDEAFETVAKELKRVTEACAASVNNSGAGSIYYERGAGDLSQLHSSPKPFHKILLHLGGYSRSWGGASFQGGVFAEEVTFHESHTANSSDNLLNSRFIILWGWNPANSICGTNTSWYMAQAKEKGAKIVAVDPRYTDSAAILAEQWIPIIPGTDAAMLIAMAYVILEEGLQDQKYLDTYTQGFEHFKNYVMGIEDGEAKTPEWAEKITGVPATVIEDLARTYATSKPAALMAGVAPGRTAYGEQYHRAAINLAAMTGNIGIHGGYAGSRAWQSASWYPYKIEKPIIYRAEDGINPVPVETDAMKRNPHNPPGVNLVELPDFILKGKAGGYPADIKLMFIRARNWVNQYPNTNKIVQALKKLEFIVIIEQVMTATAKFADIILPSAMYLERNDIDVGVGIPFYGYVNKAVEPQGECKTALDIARGLAKHLGITDFGDESEDELLRKQVAGTEIPDYDEFKEKGVYKLELEEPYVAFSKQIEDPDNNPFPTDSGKIEIFSQKLADHGDPLCPPVAKYIETWESRNDPLKKKYPLQFINTHFKRRTHGQYDRVPWLRELESQALFINKIDAESRGIKDGDDVRIFNDRGQVVIQAKITERIMPGVVDLPQGAWYDPDESGVDRGGNPNVLTRDQASPGGSFPYNTCLVQVEKHQEVK